MSRNNDQTILILILFLICYVVLGQTIIGQAIQAINRELQNKDIEVIELQKLTADLELKITELENKQKRVYQNSPIEQENSSPNVAISEPVASGKVDNQLSIITDEPETTDSSSPEEEEALENNDTVDTIDTVDTVDSQQTEVSKFEIQEGSTETQIKEEQEYIGTLRITAYCPCEKCCGKWAAVNASNTNLKAGATVAASSQFPFGTVLNIEGIGQRVVYDTVPQSIINKYGETIDLYFDDHNDALAFGCQYKDVYIVAQG